MPRTILGFIDIETTGHDPLMRTKTAGGQILLEPWHEIIDIGCVFAQTPGLEVLGEFFTKVAPRHPERCLPDLINHYPERAAMGEWKDAIPLDQAVIKLLGECGSLGRVVLPGGQNWFFDWSFLLLAFAVTDISDKVYSGFLHYKKFDVGSMALHELWDPRTPLDVSDFSLRSGKLQRALGVEPEPEPHEAISGARQAYEVFKKLSERKLLRFTT